MRNRCSLSRSLEQASVYASINKTAAPSALKFRCSEANGRAEARRKKGGLRAKRGRRRRVGKAPKPVTSHCNVCTIQRHPAPITSHYNAEDTRLEKRTQLILVREFKSAAANATPPIFPLVTQSCNLLTPPTSFRLAETLLATPTPQAITKLTHKLAAAASSNNLIVLVGEVPETNIVFLVLKTNVSRDSASASRQLFVQNELRAQLLTFRRSAMQIMLSL